MHTTKTILILFVLFLPAILQAQTSTTRVATRLRSPVFATAAPDVDDRMFILEQSTGNIRIYDMQADEVLSDPYLTVANLSTGGERGLLGLAFHPNFASNGKLYVYASQPGGSQNHRSQVFEYTAEDPMNSTTVDASTRRSVLRFDQPFGNHNGGWIGFDPTATGDARNHLYVATGDGGAANDPQNNSQDITNNLLGKILRLDVSGDDFPNSDIQNYSVPTTNPFVNQTGDDEIFAYGLRNPWRTSFDRRTGDIWIGDVGQGELEEIDVLPAGTSGQNYGWRVMEGTDCFRNGTNRDGNVPCDDASLTPPVYEYGHNNGEFGGFSVTGGYVYRGPVKEFQGQYFFADFASNNIWTRDPDSGTVLNRNAALDADTGTAERSVASFAEDTDGNLYVVSYAGSLFRVDSSSRDAVLENSAWTRDGVSGEEFVEGDHLVVRNSQLSLNEPSRLAALTLDGSASLNLGAETELTSGNITVPEGGVGTLIAGGRERTLFGTTGTIRKLGAGQLNLNTRSQKSDMLAVHEGSVDVQGGGFARTSVRNDGLLDLQDSELDDASLSINPNATLVLDFVQPNGALMESPHTVNVLDAKGTIEIMQPIDEALETILRERDITILTASAAESTGELSLEDTSNGDVALNLGSGGVVVLPEWEEDGQEARLNLTLARGIPGDANLDGVVGFADFLILNEYFGEPESSWLKGHFSGHGVIDFSEFLVLSSNFGRTGYEPFERAGVSSVPEPTAGLLFTCSLIGLMSMRRRRGSGTIAEAVSDS